MLSNNVLYSLFVALGVLVAWWVRRRSVQKLGYDRDQRHRLVGLGSLFGAVVGSKLGLVLFLPPGDFLRAMATPALEGKTILGALIGGYLGGELAKKLVGVSYSTGDAWALALPVAQAFGRVGCFFGGCCFGTPTTMPWATWSHDASRHPTPLYEAALLLCLAAWLYTVRNQERPAGWLFRYYFIGYATIRFVLEGFRGDEHQTFGFLSAAAWVCLAIVLWMTALFWRDSARVRRIANRTDSPIR